jgi:hypothetical protein
VLKTKVEISLLKVQPTLSWRSLEKGAAGPAAAGVAAAAVAPEQQQGPPRAYPSSKPTRDWGKVEGAARCTALHSVRCGVGCLCMVVLHISWLSRWRCRHCSSSLLHLNV